VRFVRAGDARALADAIHDHAGIVHTLGIVNCHADLRNRIDRSAVGGQFMAAIASRFPEMTAANDR
jgi:hypothetical protein